MRISEWSSALCSSDLRGSSRWTAWLGFPSGQSCVRTAAHCGDSAQFSAACQLARLEDAARTAARDPSHRLSLDSDRRGAARCCRNHAFYPANGGHTCAHRRRGRHDGARGDDPRVPGPHRSTADRRLACHFDLCPRQSGRTDESFGGATTQLPRSEEHTSELQSLMRISYASFCLKTKINIDNIF